jgi:cytidine deaminase
MDAADPARLLRLAEESAAQAYAPYSGFRVGAALWGESGAVHTGCNVENAAYGIALCAERAALAAAVRAGERRFRGLAVWGRREGTAASPCPPCGACRQALAEFCGPEFPVWSAGAAGAPVRWTLGALLPEAFALPPPQTDRPGGDVR